MQSSKLHIKSKSEESIPNLTSKVLLSLVITFGFMILTSLLLDLLSNFVFANACVTNYRYREVLVNCVPWFDRIFPIIYIIRRGLVVMSFIPWYILSRKFTDRVFGIRFT